MDSSIDSLTNWIYETFLHKWSMTHSLNMNNIEKKLLSNHVINLYSTGIF